tara:strand:+ start:7427 stop:7729 length:303 start_codon:yes stop_codon:yes gene_type:complete
MKYLNESTQEIVARLLKNHKHLRDNDNKLLATVWFYKKPNRTKTVMDFLHLLSDGRLPSSESIRRCRQKLQELNPNLRGKLWNKRHKMQEKVKEELKEMK